MLPIQGGRSSIPGWGTEIPHAALCGPPKNWRNWDKTIRDLTSKESEKQLMVSAACRLRSSRLRGWAPCRSANASAGGRSLTLIDKNAWSSQPRAPKAGIILSLRGNWVTELLISGGRAMPGGALTGLQAAAPSHWVGATPHSAILYPISHPTPPILSFPTCEIQMLSPHCRPTGWIQWG